MSEPRMEEVKTPQLTELANAVSAVIARFVSKGMGVDEAVSVTVAVAADYARMTYGPEYVRQVAGLMASLADEKPKGQLDTAH